MVRAFFLYIGYSSKSISFLLSLKEGDKDTKLLSFPGAFAIIDEYNGPASSWGKRDQL